MASAARVVAEVFLVPVGSESDSVGSRDLTISKDQPLITVGRSSRNKTKNLLPDFDNAYFDSPVMSRLHAWIKCDEEGKVVIADAQSMHGTFLNDKLLEPKVFAPLETGATVRFGNSVVRGSETFPPKLFDVQVVRHNSNMSPVQHGYGITSDELVLPDSPYYSEDEDDDGDDDLMITEVKAVVKKPSSEVEYWEEGLPSEIPTSAIRESLAKDRSSVDFEYPPPIPARRSSLIDLTAEEPSTQQVRNPLPRISIAELLASQERKEQSRQSSKTPTAAPEGHTVSNPMFIDTEDEEEEEEEEEEDYEPEIEEEYESSDKEMSPESTPTSPISEDYNKVAASSLPDVPVANSLTGTTPVLLERVPALDDIPVSPEVRQAWTSTWRAPLLSRFPFSPAQETTDTPDTMEQVRKAEAMRDRAHEFWRCRLEMQNPSFVTPEKEKEPANPYPTPNSICQNQSSSVPTVPLWVRNFVQGNYFGNKNSENETVSEDSAKEPTAPASPCDGRGVQEESEPEEATKASPVPPRLVSPELDVADDLAMGGIEEVENPAPRVLEHSPALPESELSQSESESESGSESESESMDETSSDTERWAPGKKCFYPSEFDNFDYDSQISEHEEEMFEFYVEEDEESEEESSMDEEEDTPLLKLCQITANKQSIVVNDTVKNAMSMENFFSPNDEPVFSSQAEWNKDTTPPAVDEATETSTAADADLAPRAAKKRKREESEEADGCRTNCADVEVCIPKRKIAPLPRRSACCKDEPPSAGTADVLDNIYSSEDADSKEEPEKKKVKVEGGRGWGSTVATALAGAIFGGVGVFAALVATAGEL